jgi:sodium-dependent dicarboxylate transporter 2/3/5
MEQKKIPLKHYAICAAFVFLFRFIPGFAGITTMGMGILGTFIGAIYGWMTIGMFWPSLVAIAGLAITLGMQPVLTYGFGSLVFFGLVFIGPLIEVCQQTGTFSWIIDKVLTSKTLQGKGFITVWILFMAAFALGFTNPIIMAMVYCSFVTQICKQVGINKNESFPVYVYIGVALSSMLGQVLLPFLGTGLTLVMAYNAMFPNYPLNFVSYLVAMMIISITLITVYTLLCKLQNSKPMYRMQ